MDVCGWFPGPDSKFGAETGGYSMAVNQPEKFELLVAEGADAFASIGALHSKLQSRVVIGPSNPIPCRGVPMPPRLALCEAHNELDPLDGCEPADKLY